MIIVTGASGQLGRRVLESLLQRVPASQIAGSVRDLEKVSDLTEKGVRIRQADFEDEASLKHAFEGGKRLLLVSSNAAAYGGDTLLQHRNAIAAAKTAGIERVFYTAQVSTAPDAHFPPGLSHFATERMLAASGMPWTSLRHGFYAASGYQLIRDGIASGTLRGPEDGKVAWTTHEDLADADAALLCGPEEFDGPVLLTSQEAFDFEELTVLASELLGKQIKREVVPDAGFREALSERLPGKQVDFLMSYYRAARAGEFASIGPSLERLIRRRPETMRDFLARTLAS